MIPLDVESLPGPNLVPNGLPKPLGDETPPQVDVCPLFFRSAHRGTVGLIINQPERVAESTSATQQDLFPATV
jgi:hypothetical protein